MTRLRFAIAAIAVLGGLRAVGFSDGVRAVLSGRCPFAAKPISPAEWDSQRNQALVNEGSSVSVRPALGFEFARTTREDAEKWAAKWHISCGWRAEWNSLVCEQVPAEALDGSHAFDTLLLGFRADGLLQDVDGTSRGLLPTEAYELLDHARTRVSAATGAAFAQRGPENAESLAKDGYGQAIAELTRGNYAVKLVAMNVGGAKASFRSQYQAIF
jgi:hypothetical protein